MNLNLQPSTPSSNTQPANPSATTQPTATAFEVHRYRSDKVVCDKYSGSKHPNKVTEWLDLFDIVTIDWPEREKLRALPRHLLDEAVSWFTLEIGPVIQTITWTECRQRMIARFGKVFGNPIVEATERRLSSREDVSNYYNDKKRLLTQANVSEDIQIELLTNGMPDYYRTLIAIHRPKTTSDWLEIAFSIESTKPKRYDRTKESSYHADVTSKVRKKYGKWHRQTDRDDNKTEDLPPKPCPHCLRLGLTNEMHWKRQCPRLNEKPPEDTQINLIHECEYTDLLTDRQPIRHELKTSQQTSSHSKTRPKHDPKHDRYRSNGTGQTSTVMTANKSRTQASDRSKHSFVERKRELESKHLTNFEVNELVKSRLVSNCSPKTETTITSIDPSRNIERPRDECFRKDHFDSSTEEPIKTYDRRSSQVCRKSSRKADDFVDKQTLKNVVSIASIDTISNAIENGENLINSTRNRDMRSVTPKRRSLPSNESNIRLKNDHKLEENRFKAKKKPTEPGIELASHGFTRHSRFFRYDYGRSAAVLPNQAVHGFDFSRHLWLKPSYRSNRSVIRHFKSSVSMSRSVRNSSFATFHRKTG